MLLRLGCLTIVDQEILPSNFTIYRKDRTQRGGGVLVAINNSIPSSIMFSPPDLEVIAVQIGYSSPLIFPTVSVPPNSNETYFILSD